MADQKQKMKEIKNDGINPVVAAVTGVVIGAGIAVAGAVALSDEKNRDKVKKVLDDVKNQATGYIEEIQKQAQDKKTEVEEKIIEGKEKVEEATEAAKDALSSK